MATENKTNHPVRSRGSLRALATSNGNKFISGLLIISMILPIVLFSVPKRAQAQVATIVNDPLHMAITNLFG